MHYIRFVGTALTIMAALSTLDSQPILKILVVFGLVVLAAPSALSVIQSLSCPDSHCATKSQDLARTVSE